MLLSRVYNKPLIVLFGLVVCTLFVVRGTHATIVECFFLFFRSKLKKLIQAIHRAKLPVLPNQISPSKYNGLRRNKASIKSNFHIHAPHLMEPEIGRKVNTRRRTLKEVRGKQCIV